MHKIAYCFVVIIFSALGALAQQTVVVIVAKDNLRGSPSVKGKVILSVKKGEELKLVRQRGDWYMVHRGGVGGWIRSSSIVKELVDHSQFNVTGVGSGRGFGNGVGNGSGTGAGSGPGSIGQGVVAPAITKPMRIVAKPSPTFTDAARTNGIQGTVILRVTFLASGQISSISVVKGLAYGLTEQAIAAARGIKFEPAESKLGPITVTKTVEYTFAPY